MQCLKIQAAVNKQDQTFVTQTMNQIIIQTVAFFWFPMIWAIRLSIKCYTRLNVLD